MLVGIQFLTLYIENSLLGGKPFVISTLQKIEQCCIFVQTFIRICLFRACFKNIKRIQYLS